MWNINPFETKKFVVRASKEIPFKEYISSGGRQFYKIFYMTSGTGLLTVGLKQYSMVSGDIAFMQPNEVFSWKTTSDDTRGCFCLVHPGYFKNSDHVLQLFQEYEHFKDSKAAVHLSENCSANIHRFFASMVKEEESANPDKQQAILLYIQMLLLEVKRKGKVMASVAVPEEYDHLHAFLSLLEFEFTITDSSRMIRIKTAKQCANLLQVKLGNLGPLVQCHTGKTIKVHIHERLLYEARMQLWRTRWDVETIGRVPGFSEHKAFSDFFFKHEKMLPDDYREDSFFRSARRDLTAKITQIQLN